MIKLKKIAILMAIVTLLGGCSNGEAQKYYKQGIEKFNNSNYEEAAKDLKSALEINNNRAEYHIDYGMTLAMLGEFEEAKENFEFVIRDSDSKIVKENNKLAYRGLGITYYLSSDYENAMDYFKKALTITALSELDEDIYQYISSAQTKSGAYEEAITSYSKLLDIDNKDAKIYNERAFAYGKLGDYEKAIQDFNKAIELKKQEFEYYFGKYFVQVEMGDVEGAKVTLSAAEHLDLDTDEANFNLAKVHYFMGKYDAAKIEFTEAAKRGFAQAYYYLGNIYEKNTDYENAVSSYKQYIDNSTTDKNATVYNQLGYIYIQLEDYKNAVETLEKGISIKDINIDETIRWNYITALEGNGEYDKAYTAIKEYSVLYPNKDFVAREVQFIESRLTK